jgi:hypothetical protein
MKKILYGLMAVALMSACQNDDTDFSEYINGEKSSVSTIYITYNETSVDVTGDSKGYVTTNGADVTVNAENSSDSLLLVLSGSTTDGSLLVYRQQQYGIKLNGVSIKNNDGPAINNQCGKWLYLDVADGTTNTLTDGTSYTDIVVNGTTIDQKGCLFSEGQVYVKGTGKLAITGNCKHGFASDDYIVIDDNVTLNVYSSAGNGIKVNDGLWINNGNIGISVTADAARGIKCDSVVVISGGSTTISTSGDCVYDTEVQDYSSAACIKCESQFTMTAGTLKLISSGDGGKGINCAADVVFSGGELIAKTTGSNDNGKPKAIKSDTGIIVSGGSFSAYVNKSWACDNGSESEEPADHITVKGSPKTQNITKKTVEITY